MRRMVVLPSIAVLVLTACGGPAHRTQTTTPGTSVSPTGVRPRPTVGVIRWDYWSGNQRSSNWVLALSQPRWRDRLPFYATDLSSTTVTIREDLQWVMDREIDYASRAGIDYWAFDFYNPAGAGAPPMHMNYGVELFKASSQSHRMRYALITTDGTGRRIWASYSDALVANFADPRYQTVAGGRPLLYLFDPIGLGYSRAGIDALRAKAVAVGLPQPYIVGMVWDAQAGAEVIDRLGLDAMGAYLLGNDPEGEHPYSAQASADRRFWEAGKSEGKEVVPLVVASHDSRPAWEYPPPWPYATSGPWYEEPTPSELAGHLNEALRWVAANPAYAAANSVLIYSWNETAEGGINLVPTRSQGTARLDAIHRVIAEWTRLVSSE